MAGGRTVVAWQGRETHPDRPAWCIRRPPPRVTVVNICDVLGFDGAAVRATPDERSFVEEGVTSNETK